MGVAFELSGPFCASPWILPQWQGTPGSGAKFRGSPPDQNFTFLARRVSPVLWPTFFLHSMPPVGTNSVTRDTRFSGQIWGSAPQSKFRNFRPDAVVVYLGPLLSCILTVQETVQDVLSGNKYCPRQPSENGAWKFWGCGTFLVWPLRGGGGISGPTGSL